MDELKIRLWLCNLIIALSLIVELCGILILLALTATGIIPVSIAAALTSVIPIYAASWYTITPGEATIVGLIYMFFGLWLMEHYADTRRAVLREIKIGVE